MSPFVPVPLERLRVTEGSLRARSEGGLDVDGPRLRAIVPGAPGDDAELRFTVLGPSSVQKPLASGAERRQVGLKLRAQDGCNVIYVMWRVTPKPGVVVNYKRNVGQRLSAECGNRGYALIKPTQGLRVPAPSPGEEHSLRARLQGTRLRVWADGALAWEGTLPAEALDFDGPVGMRSDNLRLTLRLQTPKP
ncbi:hypothetical protein LY474_26590 [Myxococcus stipitatus]|uniref:hypothetical protein n=1 Tax=Myxococcus stipitatus TaxID=83455 RepID=UPI001F47275A|nr:hypothetical protein [Myxococcus stipitatus]MCE9671378.1 hypothetical protein [Myxococcus stipitatus]